MIKRARRVRPAGFVRIDDGPHRACAAYFLPGGAARFPSEDRRMACLLLTAVVAAELGLVYVAVADINWNARFFNALERRDWNAFYANSGFLASCDSLRSCRRLAVLFRPDAADPLAALDDRELRVGLDGAGPPLSGAFRRAPSTTSIFASPTTSISSSSAPMSSTPACSAASSRWFLRLHPVGVVGGRRRCRCSACTSDSRAG